MPLFNPPPPGYERPTGPSLQVSSAVDTLMQASDQAEMQAAIGAGAPPFALSSGETFSENSDANPTIVDDGEGNVAIFGYGSDGESSGDRIQFSSNGIASVTAAADGLQLPIGRVVAQGSVSLSSVGTVGPGENTNVTVYATGLSIGDGIIISLDSGAAGWGGTGGWVGPYIVGGNGSFDAEFFNTDLTTGYAPSGNMYYKIIR